MTKTISTAEAAKTVKTVMVGASSCTLLDKQREGKWFENRQNRHEGYPP